MEEAEKKMFHFKPYRDTIAHPKYYYAFGNQPPVDLLETLPRKSNGALSQTSASFLCLGSGDLHSLIFSLWNWQTSLKFTKEKPTNLKFLLNDSHPGVVARNILFLFLIKNCRVKNPAEFKKDVADLWAFWFCHLISAKHYTKLTNNLEELYNWSESLDKWTQSPLGKLVSFYETDDLLKIRKFWDMWCHSDLLKGSDATNRLMKERDQRMKEKTTKVSKSLASFLKLVTGAVCADGATSAEVEKTKSEILQYVKLGSAYADSVLDLTDTGNSPTLNPTFFDDPCKYDVKK
jgi:hypothetical protein